MPNERRAGFGLYSDPTNVPGLVMDAIGAIYLVKPDGSRCLLDCGGGAGNTPLPSGIGDIIYSADGLTWVVLPIGAQDEVLTVDAGVPAWEPGGTSVVAGDALAFTGTTLDVQVDGLTIVVNGGNELEVVSSGVLTDAVIVNPATDARNVIQPTLATVIPLSLRGQVAQSDDLMQFQDSAALVLSRFDERGFLGIGVDPEYAIDVQRDATGAVSPGLVQDIGGIRTVSNLTSPNTVDPGNTIFANSFEVNAVNRLASTGFDHLYALHALATIAAPSVVGGDDIEVTGVRARAQTDVANTWPVSGLTGLFGGASHYAAHTLAYTTAFWFTTELYDCGIVSDVVDGQIRYSYMEQVGTIPSWRGFLISPPYMSKVTDIITQYTGIDIDQTDNAGGLGNFTNFTGIRVRAPVYSVTGSHMGIQVDGGNNLLKASVATQIPLALQGAVAQTGDYLQIQTSAAAVLTRFDERGYLGVGIDPVFAVDILRDITTAVSPPNDLEIGGLRSVVNLTSPNSGSPGSEIYANLIEGHAVDRLNAQGFDHVYALKVKGSVNAPTVSGGDDITVQGLTVDAYTGEDNTWPVAGLWGLFGQTSHFASHSMSYMNVFTMCAELFQCGIVAEVNESQAAYGYIETVGTIPLWRGSRVMTPFMWETTDIITQYYGLDINPAGSEGGSGNFTNFTGIRVAAPIYAVTGTHMAIQTDGGNNLFKASVATQVPLTLRGAAAQSGNLFVAEDSAAADLVAISAAGVVLFGSAADTNLYRSAADTLKTDDSFLVGGSLTLSPTGYWDGTEISVPATPAANHGRLFYRDSGAGVTQLVAVFPSGNTVVVAEDF